MKLLPPLLFLVLILSCLVVLFPGDQIEQPDAGAGSRVEAAAAPGLGEPNGAAGSGAAAEAERLELAEAEAWPALRPGELGWQGRVLVGESEPVPGVLVYAEAEGVVHQTRSDADGRYRLVLPAPEDPAAVPDEDPPVLEVLPENGLAYDSDCEVAPASPLAEADFVLRRGLAVKVVVLDRDGNRPLAGVPVQGWRQAGPYYAQALTDASGVATIQVTSFGECWFGIESSADCLPVEKTAWIERDGQEVILSTSQLPQRIQLQAVDASDGQPLASARFRWMEESEEGVRRSFQPPPPRGPIPSRGGRIDVAAPERPAGVLIEAPGYQATVAYQLGSSGGFEAVELSPLTEVPIRVLRGGRPVAARLSWRLQEDSTTLPEDLEHDFDGPYLEGPPWQYEARTDAGGWAALRWPEDDYAMLEELVVEPEGGLRRSYGNIRRYQMPEPPWTLELGASTATIRFRVLGQDGEPEAGAHLRVRGWSEPRQDSFDQLRRQGSRAELGEGRTDADGELLMRVPAPGGVTWVCRGRRGRLEGPLAPGEERLVRVRLLEPEASGLEIRGRLWPPSPGWTESLEELLVRVEPLGQPEEEAFFDSLDSTGTLAFQGLSPGEYRLTLVDDSEASGPAVIARAGDLEVRIPSPPLYHYLLRARGEDGQLLESWRGVAYRDGERVGWLSGSPGDPGIEEALLAPYDLIVVGAEGCAELAVRPPALPDQLCRLELTLAPARELVLWVKEDDAQEGRFAGFQVLAGPGEVPLPMRRSRHWEAAPCTSFELQPVDEDGAPLGPPVRIPAGTEDLEWEVEIPAVGLPEDPERR